MSLLQEKARIWFFTDIHGSTACFKKILNLVDHPAKPNVLIIGGDIVGKQICPIIQTNNGSYKISVGGQIKQVNPSRITEWERRLEDIGYYPYRCTQAEYNAVEYDENKRREILDRLAEQRLREWVSLANKKLPSTDECMFIINAGNDDPLFVDDILDSCPKLIRAEGKVIQLPAQLKLLSTGFTNITLWPSPREIPEQELTQKISAMTQQLNADDKVIFNFHCPPYNTSLDQANYINPQTYKPSAANSKVSVGSISVRKAIQTFKPIASLHGHVHEVHAKQYIGASICFNPGTDYKNGNLQGVFMQINPSGQIELERLTQERYSDKQLDDNKKVIYSWLGNTWIGRLLGLNKQDDRFAELERQINEMKNK